VAMALAEPFWGMTNNGGSTAVRTTCSFFWDMDLTDLNRTLYGSPATKLHPPEGA